MARLKCQHCKKEFEGRSNAKYHNDSCRAAAARERAQNRTQAFPRRSSAMTSAFTRAVRKSNRQPADGAAVALARTYARMIDADPAALDKLGPQLLQVLVQLGMTPKARGSAAPATSGGGQSSDPARRAALDELRQRREGHRGGNA